jgi:hypothetical protein
MARHGRLTLINSLVVFAVIALVGMGSLPIRALVTQMAIDDELTREGDAFAQSAFVGRDANQQYPRVATPAVDQFASRPVFIEAAALDGTVLAR